MTTPPALKKPVNKDWHWKDVLARLAKRGWSLRQVGLSEGYPDGSALGETARRPYPKAESILAAYMGIDHPMEIWPSRYDADGNPNRKQGPAPRRGTPPRKVYRPSQGKGGKSTDDHISDHVAGCNRQKAVA